MTVEILSASNASDVERAAGILLSGGLVAVPTETVYGLGADASNEAAVRRVFDVKGRPTNHPLILHVADAEAAKNASSGWSPAAEILAGHFWPGPLSILIEKAAKVNDVVTGGRTTVVVRVPDHPAALDVLRILHSRGSIGLAAPSANKFGAVSPTSARHVVDDLGDSIDAVLDGGDCRVGVESTIVDCRSDVPVILREGGVPFEAITDVLVDHGMSIKKSPDLAGIDDPVRAVAPGMLESHYAPRARVEIFTSLAELERRESEVETSALSVARLPHPDDVVEYSRNLYRWMRACDAQGVDLILAVLPPATELGAAVRDRLSKAAAAR